jgi:hypothetical protein
MLIARKRTSKGSKIASLIRNPTPMAERKASKPGVPMQQRAVNIVPKGPNLSR